MTKCALLTQTGTKRITAAAIAEAKARNGWSNGDAGDALGCGEGTIRNRLDAEDANNQMTVHELRRSVLSDGPHIANRVFADIHHRLVPTCCSSAPDALKVAGAQARCAAELIAAAPDGIDRNEARMLLPLVVAQQVDLAAMEVMLRGIIEPGSKG